MFDKRTYYPLDCGDLENVELKNAGYFKTLQVHFERYRMEVSIC